MTVWRHIRSSANDSVRSKICYNGVLTNQRGGLTPRRYNSWWPCKQTTALSFFRDFIYNINKIRQIKSVSISSFIYRQREHICKVYCQILYWITMKWEDVIHTPGYTTDCHFLISWLSGLKFDKSCRYVNAACKWMLK